MDDYDDTSDYIMYFYLSSSNTNFRALIGYPFYALIERDGTYGKNNKFIFQ
jgi:hypothetical protein